VKITAIGIPSSRPRISPDTAQTPNAVNPRLVLPLFIATVRGTSPQTIPANSPKIKNSI